MVARGVAGMNILFKKLKTRFIPEGEARRSIIIYDIFMIIHEDHNCLSYV